MGASLQDRNLCKLHIKTPRQSFERLVIEVYRLSFARWNSSNLFVSIREMSLRIRLSESSHRETKEIEISKNRIKEIHQEKINNYRELQKALGINCLKFFLFSILVQWLLEKIIKRGLLIKYVMKWRNFWTKSHRWKIFVMKRYNVKY